MNIIDCLLVVVVLLCVLFFVHLLNDCLYEFFFVSLFPFQNVYCIYKPFNQ
jgi:hypothetical protein